MKWKLLPPLFVLIALAAACRTVAGDDAAEADERAARKIAHIQRLLQEAQIDSKAFPEEMPLVEFLAAVRQQLPGKGKIALRLEEKELGKDAARLAKAPVRCPALRSTLSTFLRKALSQVTDKEELNYGIRPDGIVITRARLAVHSMVYDVGDIVRKMPSLLPALQKQALSFGLRKGDANLFDDLKSTDGLALLIRWLMNNVAMRPWEKLEILNSSRLSVLASPNRHMEIADVLAMLRRLSDVAVVMNARLYEVDRDFFRKHIAPLFAKDKERPAIIAIEQAELLKKIQQYKLRLQSEDIKLPTNMKRTFLSRHSVFHFVASPPSRSAKDGKTGTGLAGVSFEIQPLVSADRRHLRLHIRQHIAQLVGIAKCKTLDAAAGKKVEVESPNVRKSSVEGVVQILDTAPILMPVNYQPSGTDRVWLLVARPFIWIEAEAKEASWNRQAVSKNIWDSYEIPKEGTPPPSVATPLTLDEDGRAILQAVVADVLTNPTLAADRKFYGTKRDKTVALVDGEKLGWPKKFQADMHGYKLVQVRHDPFADRDRRRVLGIRLDKFDLKEKKSGAFQGPIKVCLFNAGGSANGGVIGGCSVYYKPKRAGKHWIVEFLGLLDP